MKTTPRPWLGAAHRNLLLLLALGFMLCGGRSQTTYEPGKSYFGRSNYVEYIAGDLPLVVSAPHGGKLKPAEIPDRERGTFATDDRIEEMARTGQQVFHSSFGHSPHVIICRVVRRKVDCNRDIEEGAGETPGARQVWSDFQRFVEVVRSNVLARAGTGSYTDLHGQGHPIKRVELGYCLTESQLARSL